MNRLHTGMHRRRAHTHETSKGVAQRVDASLGLSRQHLHVSAHANQLHPSTNMYASTPCWVASTHQSTTQMPHLPVPEPYQRTTCTKLNIISTYLRRLLLHVLLCFFRIELLFRPYPPSLVLAKLMSSISFKLSLFRLNFLTQLKLINIS